MAARVVESIASVPPAQWNALNLGGDPFLRHEFLYALERETCVGGATGWAVSHLLLEDAAGALEGAVPLYLKAHSWGEFVFDWSWAKAYQQSGLRYYPKLLSMVPFTPATGPRLLVKAGEAEAQTRRTLAHALIDCTRQYAASSAHVLFATDADRAALADAQFLVRKDCQFHWHNRGYATFDEFLASFRSDKRKKALRERRRVQEAGITFRTLMGDEIDAPLWAIVFGFSAATFAMRGHEHYLNVDFFKAVARTLPRSIMVKLALLRGQPIAAAIFFVSGDALYGRYWGAAADFHSLHFETCYYQGIEFCIERGLRSFEPGTQGEHKVPRGFEPTATWSLHWIADARFRRLLSKHLVEECAAVDDYIANVREHVPYKGA
jgi:uncharacterized protein